MDHRTQTLEQVRQQTLDDELQQAISGNIRMLCDKAGYRSHARALQEPLQLRAASAVSHRFSGRSRWTVRDVYLLSQHFAVPIARIIPEEALL